MPTDKWSETATLWFLVRSVAGRMDRTGDALYREGLGVSLSQFLVLSVVDAFPGPINQQAVAERLGLTKGTVSRQIEAAVQNGHMLVEPAPHSRRENLVRLTPQGETIVRKGDVLLTAALERVVPDLDATELAATIRALTALNDALGGPRVPSWRSPDAQP